MKLDKIFYFFKRKITFVYFASISCELLFRPEAKILALFSTPIPVFSMDVLLDRWFNWGLVLSTANFGFTAVILDIELDENFKFEY